jgi:hypothetical protein
MFRTAEIYLLHRDEKRTGAPFTPGTDRDSRLQFRRIPVARRGLLLGAGLGDNSGNLQQLFNGERSGEIEWTIIPAPTSPRLI